MARKASPLALPRLPHAATAGGASQPCPAEFHRAGGRQLYSPMKLLALVIGLAAAFAVGAIAITFGLRGGSDPAKPPAMLRRGSSLPRDGESPGRARPGAAGQRR